MSSAPNPPTTRESLVCIPGNEYVELLQRLKSRKPGFVVNKFGHKEAVVLREGQIYERNTGLRVCNYDEMVLGHEKTSSSANHWGELFMTGFRTVQPMGAMTLLKRGDEFRMYMSQTDTSATATLIKA